MTVELLPLPLLALLLMGRCRNCDQAEFRVSLMSVMDGIYLCVCLSSLI